LGGCNKIRQSTHDYAQPRVFHNVSYLRVYASITATLDDLPCHVHMDLMMYPARPPNLRTKIPDEGLVANGNFKMSKLGKRAKVSSTSLFCTNIFGSHTVAPDFLVVLTRFQAKIATALLGGLPQAARYPKELEGSTLTSMHSFHNPRSRGRMYVCIIVL
jgi:hypothetical protein